MQADLVAKAGSDTVYFGTDECRDSTTRRRRRWPRRRGGCSPIPSVRGSIEGHADERGTREYNLALGERRANAAKRFPDRQGVPAARLTVTSWGKERPVATGSDEERLGAEPPRGDGGGAVSCRRKALVCAGPCPSCAGWCRACGDYAA